MWYAGQSGAGAPQRAPPRSSSTGALRPSSASRRRAAAGLGQAAQPAPPQGRHRDPQLAELLPRAARQPRDSGAQPPWQLPRAARGAGLKPLEAAGLRALGQELGSAMALDTADRAEELLRVGVWSVRRHTAGLVFVNTETGCAQAEAPREVLADLGLEEDGGLGLGAPRTEAAAEGGDAGGQAELGSTSATSRPWSVSSGGQAGERGGDSALEHPLGAEEASPRFHRILLGSERGMPLAMARDIVAALREDASLFEVVRKKFSDLPMETEIDMGSLSEELGGIAATLRPGEFSGVIGTEAGMQILLRVC